MSLQAIIVRTEGTVVTSLHLQLVDGRDFKAGLFGDGKLILTQPCSFERGIPFGLLKPPWAVVIIVCGASISG